MTQKTFYFKFDHKSFDKKCLKIFYLNLIFKTTRIKLLYISKIENSK